MVLSSISNVYSGVARLTVFIQLCLLSMIRKNRYPCSGLVMAEYDDHCSLVIATEQESWNIITTGKVLEKFLYCLNFQVIQHTLQCNTPGLGDGPLTVWHWFRVPGRPSGWPPIVVFTGVWRVLGQGVGTWGSVVGRVMGEGGSSSRHTTRWAVVDSVLSVLLPKLSNNLSCGERWCVDFSIGVWKAAWNSESASQM